MKLMESASELQKQDNKNKMEEAISLFLFPAYTIQKE